MLDDLHGIRFCGTVSVGNVPTPGADTRTSWDGTAVDVYNSPCPPRPPITMGPTPW